MNKNQKLATLVLLAALSLACLTTQAGIALGPPVGQTPTASPTANPTNTPQPARCARVTADSLHVRYEPDYTAPIAGWFTQDTVLTVKDSTGFWWKVDGPGIDAWGRDTRMTGFVKAEYLEETPCLTLP